MPNKCCVQEAWWIQLSSLRQVCRYHPLSCRLRENYARSNVRWRLIDTKCTCRGSIKDSDGIHQNGTVIVRVIRKFPVYKNRTRFFALLGILARILTTSLLIFSQRQFVRYGQGSGKHHLGEHRVVGHEVSLSHQSISSRKSSMIESSMIVACLGVGRALDVIPRY